MGNGFCEAEETMMAGFCQKPEVVDQGVAGTNHDTE
jgi:hypothetical protein